uniref:Nephrin n=1 Tax=Meloidogyne hapla TaxID=6305 RepID=A0A1I8BQD4_MELHA
MPLLNLLLQLFSSKIHFILFMLLLTSLQVDSHKIHFKEHPKNYSAIIGSDVLLGCSIAQTDAPFQIQWYTKGSVIYSEKETGVVPGFAGRYRLLKESDGELNLAISNLTLDDDGLFQCQVIGPHGIFLRSHDFVEIIVPPRIVRFQNYQSGQTLIVNEGSQINLTCISEQSKPQADLNIFLNGKKATENIDKSIVLLKNGTINTIANLILRPGKIHHNIVISCEANHPETSTKMRDFITLDVYCENPSDRPKIDLMGSNGDNPLLAGQNITLLCIAEGGNPPPQLLWSSNQKGQLNSTYVYDASSQITQNDLSFIVSGADNDVTFECTSQSHQNMTPLISRITLHVDYPPASVFLYGSTVVRKGEALTMSCTSSVSSPAATITWQINGSPTQKQIQHKSKQLQGFVTQSNITIDSTMLLHGQNQILVACIASNGVELPVQKSQVIRVLSPPSHPVIVESETNTVPLEGVLYNLTCESQGGHPFATISWFRGVEKLKEAENSLNGDSSVSTLTLLLDRAMNGQQIRCEAENGATDLPLVAKKNLVVLCEFYFQLCFWFLQIIFSLVPPIQVRVKPTRNVHMIANSPTELSCTVPSSNPMAELSWEFPNTVDKQLTISRNGEQIRKSSKPVGEYHGYEAENIIQFTPTEAMDGAEVRCIASHHLWNEKKYGNYALDIKYPPRIAIEGQMSIVVGEGQSFEENITIYSNPRVNAFAWRKDGFTIDRSIGTIFVRQSVIGGIGVTKEDTGIYTLLVSNGVGTANATISLIVEYSARITRINNPVIASIGEDIVLECEADGNPLKLGMIKWFRGQEEVKPFVLEQHRSVLRIIATHENSGAYTCLVDNGIGKPNSSIAYLLVRRAPEIVKRPGFNRAAGPIGGKATLRCRASAVPNAEFTWGIEGEGHMIHHNTTKYRFFDTQLDHTTFQSTLTILNLDERDYMRRYRCRVSNRLGLAHTFISVGPPTAPEQPSELEIINITNTSASISWIPGFDGGSDQLFELIYQDMDENQLFTINTSLSNIVLNDLKTKHGYSLQIRAINARGDISDLTPPLIFRTLEEMLQNGIVDNMLSKKRPISHSTIIALCFGLLGLLLLNIILICYLNRRNKRRKIMARNSQQNGSSSSGSGRTIQVYGTMSALQNNFHQPQIIQQQHQNQNGGRNGSNSTINRSDLQIVQQDQSIIDDTQSARTMIEAPTYYSNGGTLIHQDHHFYNPNCVVSDDPLADHYARFQRQDIQNVNFNTQNGVNYSSSMGPVFDKNLSYQALPNPDPYTYTNNSIDGRHYSGYVPSGVNFVTTTESINNGGNCSNNNSLQRNRTTLMSTFHHYNGGGGNYDSSSIVRGGGSTIISGHESNRGVSGGGGEFL